MKPKQSYADKLKNPLWQKKRLEIFERDKFTCRLCDNTEKTLHVHHRRYKRGKEPWEYDDSNFVTLCEACHESVGKLKEDLGALVDHFIINGLLSDVVDICSDEDCAAFSQLTLIVSALKKKPHLREPICMLLYQNYKSTKAE